MNASLQASLLDLADAPGFGSLDGLQRTELTEGAWVDMLPGWLTGADELFSRLLHAVPWRAERRRMYDRVVDVPRLLCFYGEDEPLPDPLLAAARQALDEHYAAELGEPFVTAGLCLYRDGRDSVAWHGDTIGRGSTQDTMVAILSLGTPRPLLLRPAGGAGRPCATTSATVTCWSWAAAASAPGSTPSRSPPGRRDPGSASSSAPAACAEAVR